MKRAILIVVVLASGCDVAAIDTVGAVYRNGHQWCTATLIAPQVALTAAHCITNEELSFAGERVVEAIAHPDYLAGNLANDIGILRLEHPADLPVAELGTLPTTGAALTAVGFRTQERVDYAYSVRKVTSAIVYMDAVDAGLCYGDSGGPSFNTDGQLVSVHSRSGCESFAVDVAVAPHMNWIAAQAGLLSTN